MSENKSSRNKTIELSNHEIARFEGRLLSINDSFPLQSVVDRTILGDAVEIIDSIPNYIVDLIFVDPPYNINKVFGKTIFKKMDNDRYEAWTRAWLRKVVDKLKPTASIYVCGDWRSSPIIFKVLSEFFKVRNRITWEREKGRGAKTNWKNASEDIWFATVGERYYFDVDSVKLKKKVIAPYKDKTGKPKDWLEEPSGNYRLTFPSNLWTDLTVPFWSMSENTSHPTQKPEKLVAKAILASSKPGDLVFDPFLGSGTTSVVAKKLDRRYLGIEIEKYYACIAEKRLEMAEVDPRIQGYEDGVFWERNTNPERELIVSDIHQQRLPL